MKEILLDKGCVYFIKHNYTDYVKIGMTNSDFNYGNIK